MRCLLIVDATTGQNGFIQAKQFVKDAGVSGVILTKLDGTARGGIAFAIAAELGLPIKYAGTGERVNDIAPFDATGIRRRAVWRRVAIGNLLVQRLWRFIFMLGAFKAQKFTIDGRPRIEEDRMAGFSARYTPGASRKQAASSLHAEVHGPVGVGGRA